MPDPVMRKVCKPGKVGCPRIFRISNFRTIGNLLLSGVLERHPTLHLIGIEKSGHGH